MCPGGYVIGAASATGQLVTNGMSFFQRDSGVANSALVVTVTPTDWDQETLGGISMQEELEEKGLYHGWRRLSGSSPVSKGFSSSKGPRTPWQRLLATYKPGVTPANLWELLAPGTGRGDRPEA